MASPRQTFPPQRGARPAPAVTSQQPAGPARAAKNGAESREEKGGGGGGRPRSGPEPPKPSPHRVRPKPRTFPLLSPCSSKARSLQCLRPGPAPTRPHRRYLLRLTPMAMLRSQR